MTPPQHGSSIHSWLNTLKAHLRLSSPCPKSADISKRGLALDASHSTDLFFQLQDIKENHQGRMTAIEASRTQRGGRCNRGGEILTQSGVTDIQHNEHVSQYVEMESQ